MRTTMLRSAFWICVLAILAMSLMPPVPQMPTTGWDKSNHMLGFAVLAVLAHWALPGRTALALLGLVAFGGLIEILQSLTPYRQADFADLIADGAGLLVGEGLARLLTWWRPHWRTTVQVPAQRRRG